LLISMALTPTLFFLLCPTTKKICVKPLNCKACVLVFSFLFLYTKKVR